MTALVLMTMLTADPACFVPRDATPGWKQVALPADAPALAAPEGVDQFRADEWVDVVEEHYGVYQAGSPYSPGRTTFSINPGRTACKLEVTFRDPLRGAKVDVSAWGSMGTMTLRNEDRVAGRSLLLEWGQPGVSSVTVTVHDHLREAPVIASYASSCRVTADRLEVSDAFRLERSLYYLQPQGPAVVLCNKPAIPMRVRSANLPRAGYPASVTLRRD